MGQLKIPYNGKLIEGYPIGIDKIILGDLREKKMVINGENSINNHAEGTLLYDRTEKKHQPWFILVYESGRRIKND